MHDPAYQIEGQTVLTWEENIYAKYIREINEDEMETHLESALIAELAFRFCYPLTQSNSATDRFEQRAKDALEEARTTDSQVQPHIITRTDRLQLVRR